MIKSRFCFGLSNPAPSPISRLLCLRAVGNNFKDGRTIASVKKGTIECSAVWNNDNGPFKTIHISSMLNVRNPLISLSVAEASLEAKIDSYITHFLIYSISVNFHSLW